MSVLGKTKATGYALTGVGVAGVSGLLAANGAKKFGPDEITTILDGGTRAFEELDSYLSGEDLDDPTEIDYTEDALDNISSGAIYGGLGAAGIYGASRLFRSAGDNW